MTYKSIAVSDADMKLVLDGKKTGHRFKMRPQPEPNRPGDLHCHWAKVSAPRSGVDESRRYNNGPLHPTADPLIGIYATFKPGPLYLFSPIQQGDRIFIKETLLCVQPKGICYRAGGEQIQIPDDQELIVAKDCLPPGFMPAWAARFEMVAEDLRPVCEDGIFYWDTRVRVENIIRETKAA